MLRSKLRAKILSRREQKLATEVMTPVFLCYTPQMFVSGKQFVNTLPLPVSHRSFTAPSHLKFVIGFTIGPEMGNVLLTFVSPVPKSF